MVFILPVQILHNDSRTFSNIGIFPQLVNKYFKRKIVPDAVKRGIFEKERKQ